MQDRTAQLPRATASLSAAECAARTGLTTRALRIYERRGLITPPRTARGWRRYGEGELTRLNSIAMLKLAGFTLTKIRTMLTADHAPTLEQLLRAQLQDWKSRQMQAETGQRVACAALQRLQGSQVVPLDELCQLVRSAVLENSTSAFQQLTRYIGEQHPQLLHADGTRRPVRLWIAAEDGAAQMQKIATYQEQVRTQIDAPLEQLQQQGVEPWAAQVQAVMRRHQELLAEYRVREITLQRLTSPVATDSDPVLAALQQQVRADMLRKLKQRPTDGTELLASHWTTNPFLIAFFSRAELHSEQCCEIDRLLVDCKSLLQLHPDPTSRAARALARRLRRLCRNYTLGDPLTFARWAALVRAAPVDMSDLEDKASWIFLISAQCCLH